MKWHESWTSVSKAVNDSRTTKDITSTSAIPIAKFLSVEEMEVKRGINVSIPFESSVVVS